MQKRARRSTRGRKWPLERVAAFAAFAIVALTAFAVGGPIWLLGARETASLAGRMNAAIVADAEREIAALFKRIEGLQETARSVLATGGVDVDDRASREALFLGLLRADPAISWISFGFENGDFYGANRRDLGRYRLVESRWFANAKSALRRTDYLFDYEGALYRTHAKSSENDYNAAERAWFKAAMSADGPAWTSVYRFDTSGRPGLNTSVKVERDGELLGVVSVAIELDRLDDWLASRMDGRDGVAFVLSDRRQVIASSEPVDDATPELADGLLPTPQESGRPVLAAVARYLSGLPVGVTEGVVLDTPALGGEAFLNLTPLSALDWTIGTILPARSFAGDITAERRQMLLAALAAFLLTAAAATVLTRRLFVEPLQAAANELQRFRRFELTGRRPLRSAIREVSDLGDGLEGARESLAAMARYAPSELARTLLENGAAGAPAVERRTITVLFIDLEGFTTATERLGHRMAPQLNTFLATMADEIRETGGTVDKFIGDAVMALFGAPRMDENHALNACRAALACVRALDRLNRGWEEAGLPTCRMRVGVNTGRVLVGSIGAPNRLNYTAIGDPVNLAARLESLNRDYGTTIMIGAQTFDLVKYDVAARRLDDVRVKGKTERVPAYELLDLAVGDRHERESWVAAYEAGLEAAQAGDLAGAARRFEEAIALRPGGDPAAAAQIARLKDRPGARDPAFERLETAAAALHKDGADGGEPAPARSA